MTQCRFDSIDDRLFEENHRTNGVKISMTKAPSPHNAPPPAKPSFFLDRRRFICGTGLTLAGLALSYKSVAETPTAPPDASTDLSDWVNVRAQFGISPGYIHLSSFFLASHPRIVRETIDKYRRQLDENPFLTVEEDVFGNKWGVERAVAEYLGGEEKEIALTDSTTMGLALVYHGLPIKEGQEILTTAHDHYSHHESIRLAAERAGARMRKIRLFDDFESISADEIVARIRKGISPATRVVGVTWVHSSSGLRLPIRRIADAIGEVNRERAEADRVLLVVDGVHGLGAVDETVAEMGADFFVAGTHKWLFGPRGTGLIWAKTDTWKKVRPVIPAFAAGPYQAWLRDQNPGETQAAWVTPGGFHSFEHRWALPAAVEFHRQIGRARVAERIHALNDLAKEGLSGMKKVKVHTPRDRQLSAGMICFDIDGMRPAAVVERLLAKNVIASETPYTNSHARIAPSLLNSEEEIDKTLRYVHELT
jgi:selenocysteine lyase/cysteine desulfurase